MKNITYTKEDFAKWGKRGGNANLKKYGKKAMRERGKRGGLMRKLKALKEKA